MGYLEIGIRRQNCRSSSDEPEGIKAGGRWLSASGTTGRHAIKQTHPSRGASAAINGPIRTVAQGTTRKKTDLRHEEANSSGVSRGPDGNRRPNFVSRSCGAGDLRQKSTECCGNLSFSDGQNRASRSFMAGEIDSIRFLQWGEF